LGLVWGRFAATACWATIVAEPSARQALGNGPPSAEPATAFLCTAATPTAPGSRRHAQNQTCTYRRRPDTNISIDRPAPRPRSLRESSLFRRARAGRRSASMQRSDQQQLAGAKSTDRPFCSCRAADPQPNHGRRVDCDTDTADTDERGGRRSRPCTHTAMRIDRSACLANLHCSLPSVLGAERSIIRSLHACIPVHAWRLSANHKHRSNKRVEPAPEPSSWSLGLVSSLQQFYCISWRRS